MSRLIEQLRASDFPDKTPRDLTLEYGQWLEKNARKDIFLANPDFAQEYETIKDEIARARRPGYGEEFLGSIGSSFDSLQESGFGVLALAAHGAKEIGIPGAEPIRNNLLRLMKEQEAEAAEFQPSVSSYENIQNVDDVGRFATYSIGTLIPTVIQSAIGTTVGAALGSAVGPAGTIGGAFLGLAERKLAQKAVSKLLERGVKTVTLEQAAKAVPRELVEAEAKRLAIQYGGQAALAASSVGSEVGSIYAENPDAPGAALGYGIPAGLLDVIPEAYIASRFIGPGMRVGAEEAKKSVGYFRRFAQEVGKLVPMEGTTEAAQTLLEIAAAKSGRGEDPWTFTDTDYKAMVNAGIIGGIGALAMAPGSAFANPNARPDTNPRLAQTVLDRLPPGPGFSLDEDYSAPLEQPPMALNEQYDQPGEQILTVPPVAMDERYGVAQELPVAGDESEPFQLPQLARRSAEVFMENEADPSVERGVLFEEPSGAFGVTPQPTEVEIPKSVQKAVEGVNEAVRAVAAAQMGVEPPLVVLPDEPAAPSAAMRSAQVFIDDDVQTQRELQSPASAELLRAKLAAESKIPLPTVEPETQPAEAIATGPAVGTELPAPDAPALAGVSVIEPWQMTRNDYIKGNTPKGSGRNGAWKASEAQTLDRIHSAQGKVHREAVEQAVKNGEVVPVDVLADYPELKVAGDPTVVARETIIPSQDTSVGKNAAGETLYERSDGSRYRMRNDRKDKPNGYPDFGGDLAPVPVIQPTGVVTAPTGEQVVASGANGVKPLPSDSVPNLRRLQVFEVPRATPRVEGQEGEPRSIQPIEAGALGPSPMVELVKRVKKAPKADSNVTVLIVDNQTGQAFQRLAYGGPSNTVNIDMASRREPNKKAYGTIQGSTTSQTADFVNGTKGRPISGQRGVFAETMANGMPRYTIYGIGELTKPGTLANWNLGPIAQLASHPGINEAARRGWTEQAVAVNSAKDEMPKVPKFTLETGGDVIVTFQDAMAAWVSRHDTAVGRRAAEQRINEYGDALAKAFKQPKEGKAFAEAMKAQIREKTKVALAQTQRISDDYTVPNAAVIDLYRSTLRALVEGRQVDVAAFDSALFAAADSASKTTGVIITPDGRRPIVAFAASALNGPVDPATIISLMHEVGHFVTDGLAEPLRVAFQESIARMSWRSNPQQAPTAKPEVRTTTRVAPKQTDTAAFKSWFGKSRAVDAQGKPRVLYHGTSKDFTAFDPSTQDSRALYGPGFYLTASRDVSGGDGSYAFKGSYQEDSVIDEIRASSVEDARKKFFADPSNSEYVGEDAEEVMFIPDSDGIVTVIEAWGLEGTPNVMPVYAAIENPFMVDDVPNNWEAVFNRLIAAAESIGIDRGSFDNSLEYLERGDFNPSMRDLFRGLRFAQDEEGKNLGKATAVKIIKAAGYDGIMHTGGLSSKYGSGRPHDVLIAFRPEQIKSSTGNTGAFDPTNRDIRFTVRTGAGWLMNPRSLDIRLLANADPAQLSPEQRRALESLTVEEIAAARRIDPAALLEEQMAEHLAQLGWDKSEAKGAVQALIRLVKEIWFNMAMAIQKALKGADNISPTLARAYVENRFLQFIHRDSAYASDRINDLMNWLGVPATESQKIPVFPAGPDWDQRMAFIDVATGEIIPVKTGNYTPDAQTRELKLALNRAAQWVAEFPASTTPDTSELRFTKRAFFAAPQSSTPSVTLNGQFARINREDEMYRSIAADTAIAPQLPRPDGQALTHERFVTEWLSLPKEQTPASRKARAIADAAKPDPLTGQPIAHQPDITIDTLPSVEQRIVDREGRPKVVQITEAQDDAIKQLILSVRDTHRRVAAVLARETERFDALTREKERQARTRGEFPAFAQYQLSALGESILIRQRIALRLGTEIDRLYAKLDPSDIVKVFSGAEVLSVPNADATEEEIRGNRKYRIQEDLTYTSKDAISELGAEITRGEAWLKNPANRDKGQIYGIISETVRKLRQIPLRQERAGVSALLRKITGGFIDQLNASGLPTARLIGKRFAGATAFISQYRSDAETLGRRWSTAFGRFAEAMGRPNDGAFVEEIWDPLSRVWNFIDSSERAQLGTPSEANIFEAIEREFKNSTGMSIAGDKQRAALRALTMQTIETERFFGQIFDHHPELKVKDEQLGVYRRLLTHGIVTGRRGLRREMFALAQRMNPLWSDTKQIGPNDARTFWESAGDLYKTDRAAFDARMAELMDGYVTEDFVAPLAQNNTPLFTVTASDGTSRPASILNVRQAWIEAAGDVTKFAEILHQLEGAPDGMESQTVGFVLGNLHERFERLKGIIDKQNAADNIGVETLQRQMLDGREANDLPAQWVSYATMDSDSNLTLVHQLAMQASFGPDALAPSKGDAFGERVSKTGADILAAGGELSESVHVAKRELTAIRDRFNVMVRDGLSPKEIEAAMGPDDFLIAENSAQIAANLDYVETNFRQLHSVTNYLNTDLQVASNVVGLMSTGMVQNFRSAMQQIGDILGPIVDLGLSTQTLRVLRNDIKSLAAQIGNSVFESFAQQAAFAVPAAQRRKRIGSRSSETRVSCSEKTQSMGPRNLLGTPKGFEKNSDRLARTVTRLARRVRDVAPNIGSPFAEPSDERLGTKLTLGVFHTATEMAKNVNIDAAYDLYADIAARGVEYLQAIPATERAQFVRELELGIRDLGAKELGFYGGFILNDKAAFEKLKVGLETQFTGERSVGDFVAKAFRRMEAAQRESDAGRGDGSWDIISDSQFVDIANYATSHWTLETNFATLPSFMQGPWRPLWIFLTWPYLAMRRAAEGFTDAHGRMTWAGANSSVANGLKAFFIVSTPATIAGSFAIDWYDEYILGKKQNLKAAPASTAIPIVGAVLHPEAFIERWARYGTAGFPSDIINMAVNYDSARGLSLDNRVVAVNAIGSLFNAAIKTPIQTEWNLTYASFGRPILQSVGGGGVLQYLQVAQNLLGLNNQDAAVNARINTGNYLRAAGRVLDLPVAVFTGPTGVPGPISPYLQQMELAALVNNTELFRSAYRNAVQAARDEKKENPEKYVADNFAERHPLKRLFKGAVSESDYRKMLGEMGEYGATQVRAAINSYNRTLNTWFSKKSYYGRPDKGAESVEDLIRRATQLNVDLVEDSVLAAP